jgi:hypothetical protein
VVVKLLLEQITEIDEPRSDKCLFLVQFGNSYNRTMNNILK